VVRGRCDLSHLGFAAVVLAAGKGTRMNSGIPKVLQKVCGRELLNLVIDASTSAGISQVSVVVPKDHSSFSKTIERRGQLSIQQSAEGSGHALLAAREHVHSYENIIVLNGDVPLISHSTIQNMMQNHTEKKSIITVLVCEVPDPKGLGRIIRDDTGNLISIVEEIETNQSNRHTSEINAGIYCFNNSWLWKTVEYLKPSRSGEIYITDLIALAHKQGISIQSFTTHDQNEIKGINNKIDLSVVENIMRKNICEELMLKGVTIIDPNSTYLDHGVKVGKDSVIHPNCHIRGNTNIGIRTTVGPNTIIRDSDIGDDCNIINSVIEETILGNGVTIGPFSHTRKGTKLDNNVHIGNHAEIKNSTLGPGTKMGHFSYIGDADVGSKVNIGAGTITCNYDGTNKNRTTIKDEAFIGSDTMLIAPVKVGRKSITGAGSVISKDVPDNSKAVGAPARIMRGAKRSL
jgi:bifunctional UDP-N-acetylglucosamine pyrophosphorylase/glucosamine-1-phosphate N-acetyltransferase